MDARVVIDTKAAVHSTRKYAHLAIRPYPEEYITQRQLKDGTAVVLRPIKPEDEPMWHELLAHCSKETIRSRFNALIKQSTHEMATRYCFVDYDREIAIVAEIEEEGQRKLAGWAGWWPTPTIKRPNTRMLIGDRWQGRGLGSMVCDYCLEVAKRWGVKRIVAEVAKDNTRMLTTFTNRGFTRNQQEEDVVLFSRDV